MSGSPGKLSFGHSEVLSRKSTLEKLPGVKSEGLCGGILYHDGQFDDARYAIALLRTSRISAAWPSTMLKPQASSSAAAKSSASRRATGRAAPTSTCGPKAVVNAYRRSRRSR